MLLFTEDRSTTTEIRRAMKKIMVEGEIIEKSINALKATVVRSDETLKVQR